MQRRTVTAILLLMFTASVQSSILTHNENTRDSIIVSAVVRIISDDHTPIPPVVHFVHTKQDDILTMTIVGIRNLSAYSIEESKHVSDWYHRRFVIIFIDGQNDFLNFVDKLTSSYFHHRGFYIIVVKTIFTIIERLKLSEQIFKTFFDLYFDNVNILFMDESRVEVSMYTFFPCSTSHRCYEVVPVLYNTFDGEQFRKAIPHFPKKWTNFNGCPLVIVIYNFPPHIKITQTNNSSWKVEGIDGKILLEMASHLNFSMKFIHSPSRGSVFSNGTATDSLAVLLNGPANFTIGGLFQTVDRAAFLTPSQGYLQIDVVFALSVPEEYGSVERILLPFKQGAWAILCATIFSALIFFTILKRFGGRYRRFIIGDHSRGPFLEMYQTLSGLGLPKAPKYTFARTLFALWMIAGLILTTCYRSKFFDFLVSRATKRLPETFSDMKEMEYDLYIPVGMITIVPFFYGGNPRIHVINTRTYSYAWYHYEMLQVARGRRRALAESKILVDYFNAYNFRKGVLPILPQKIFTGTSAMYFKKDSYLSNVFNGILQNFVQSGLIEKSIKDNLNVSSLSSFHKGNEPKVLLLFHFAGAFKIYGVLIGCSLLMFIVELASVRCNRLLRIVQFYTETE